MNKLHFIILSLLFCLILSGCQNIETGTHEVNVTQIIETYDNYREENNMYRLVIKNVKYEKKGLFTSYQDYGGIVRVEPTNDNSRPYIIQGDCADQLSVQIDEESKTILISKAGTISKNSVEIIIYEKVCELQIENSAIKVDADFQTTKNVRITCDSLMTGTIKTQSDDFHMTIEGAGEIKLEGTSNYASIFIDGAAEISAESLIAQNADIVINGAGKCSVFVRKTLNAKIDGVGSIDYYGNPETVNKTVDGLGKITAK